MDEPSPIAENRKKMEEQTNRPTVALLIDADNSRASALGAIVRKISAYGRVVERRAYGNWSKDTLKSWRDSLVKYAIRPEQQFDYVPKKNATDIALVIDAMDLLYSGRCDVFAIVSSDSDFTPLAVRLRGSGARVIGFGKAGTSEAFRKACDEFIEEEDPAGADPVPAAPAKPRAPLAAKKLTGADPVPAAPAKPTVRCHFIRKLGPAAPATPTAPAGKYSEMHKRMKDAWINAKDEKGFADIRIVCAKIGKGTLRELTDGMYTYFIKFVEAFPDRYEVKKVLGKNNKTTPVFRCKK